MFVRAVLRVPDAADGDHVAPLGGGRVAPPGGAETKPARREVRVGGAVTIIDDRPPPPATDADGPMEGDDVRRGGGGEGEG